jgi:hypothetical protein
MHIMIYVWQRYHLWHTHELQALVAQTNLVTNGVGVERSRYSDWRLPTDAPDLV